MIDVIAPFFLGVVAGALCTAILIRAVFFGAVFNALRHKPR